jgi:uncharacterized protein YjiS (DUF1127 family)
MASIESSEYVEPKPQRIRLPAQLRALWATLMRWHQQRGALAALAELDPHLLTDMGFVPDEIYAATDFRLPKRSAGWAERDDNAR